MQALGLQRAPPGAGRRAGARCPSGLVAPARPARLPAPGRPRPCVDARAAATLQRAAPVARPARAAAAPVAALPRGISGSGARARRRAAVAARYAPVGVPASVAEAEEEIALPLPRAVEVRAWWPPPPLSPPLHPARRRPGPP
jgi:hypothetical protein